MSLTDQLNTTARIVLDRYAPAAKPASRVEGGARPSGGGTGGQQPTEGTYESLAPQYKAECDAQGERLGLIGKGKAFPTLKEWRVHYAREIARYAPGVGYDFRPPGN